MKKLLKYLKDYTKESILGPLFKLLEASFELIVPLIVANIIDIGIKNDASIQYVFKKCLILCLLAVLGLIASLTAQYFAAKAAVGFTTKIREVLYSHIHTLSYSQMDNIGASTLITRLTSDMNQVQSGVNLTLRLLLRSPFVVIGAMIMAFTVDVKSALIFVVTIPVLSVVVFTIMLISMPKYKKVQQNLDVVLSKTRENLTGTRVIRAFCKENEEIEQFTEKNDFLARAQMSAAKISSFMNPLTFVLINIAIIILIYSGGIRVNVGMLSTGMVVALYNYMSQILVELIKLASLIINITKSVASGNRIQAVLEIKPEFSYGTKDSISNNEIAIKFSNVSFSYNNSENALSNASFEIKSGTTVGIIGSTGSGKSTLINLIPRFYDTTDGEVLIFSNNVKEYKKDYLRKIIGIVPQSTDLFKGTIRDNILMGNEDATDEEIMKAIKTAQAEVIINEKKGGLDFVLEQSGKNLSGGQRQRIAIARAIVKKPKILILDDSSSALDYATDACLRKALRNEDFKPTIIVVSQRTSSIKNADKIIVLDDGNIVGIGTASFLMQNCEVFKEISNSQIKKEEQK